jgi:hypothetical protein
MVFFFWFLVASLFFVVYYFFCLFVFLSFFVGVAWGSFLVVICFLMVLFFLVCEFVSLRFPRISARGSFSLRKITTDPHILAHVNRVCLDKRYQKLKIHIS